MYTGMNPNLTAMQMQMNMGMGMQMMGMQNQNIFYFTGNSLSLNSRLQTLNDIDLERIVDATIIVTGVQLRPMNMTGLLCTTIWGGIVIFPLCFMCCDWWKKCVYPSYEITANVYMNLRRLFLAPNLRNVTLTVVDNLFDANKASILYGILSQSRLQGFTFINKAMHIDYNTRQFSDFKNNMRPIKKLTNMMSDIRWYDQIVL